MGGTNDVTVSNRVIPIGKMLSAMMSAILYLCCTYCGGASGNGGNGKRKLKAETENWSGKWKRKSWNGKWSSTFVALMPSFAHARSVWGYNIKWHCQCLSLDICQHSLTAGYKIPIDRDLVHCWLLAQHTTSYGWTVTTNNRKIPVWHPDSGPKYKMLNAI